MYTLAYVEPVLPVTPKSHAHFL